MNRKDSIISEIFKILVLLFLIITLGIIGWIIGSTLHAKFIKKVIREQPVVYQIDTAKVQVLYEDTWGKILFVKEEDL